jgi:two-component system LytT family response regulator
MPEPPRLRVLIVEDETHARERLRALLATERDVEIVGECANGRDAVVAIRAQRPELVFLDVQMPGLTGFDVCEAVGAAQMPCVIFVTAHDQYAVDAFSVHAIDYLLKPFDEERFRKSLRHAREFLARDRAGGLAGDSDLESLLARLRAQAEPERRLALKTDGRVVLLRGEEVDAAALEAVRKSTFEPALVGERAVPCSVQVPIQFRLQRRS